jgi:hypothetical protein
MPATGLRERFRGRSGAGQPAKFEPDHAVSRLPRRSAAKTHQTCSRAIKAIKSLTSIYKPDSRAVHVLRCTEVSQQIDAMGHVWTEAEVAKKATWSHHQRAFESLLQLALTAVRYTLIISRLAATGPPVKRA